MGWLSLESQPGPALLGRPIGLPTLEPSADITPSTGDLRKYGRADDCISERFQRRLAKLREDNHFNFLSNLEHQQRITAVPNSKQDFIADVTERDGKRRKRRSKTIIKQILGASLSSAGSRRE